MNWTYIQSLQNHEACLVAIKRCYFQMQFIIAVGPTRTSILDWRVHEQKAPENITHRLSSSDPRMIVHQKPKAQGRCWNSRDLIYIYVCVCVVCVYDNDTVR